MLKTTTVVVGAGHSGLAMSRCLADRSIDHVVLERGEVAHSWRTQRWDSLRLLTPNWMTRLPGYAYRGDDPDGYLAASDVAELIAEYAKETAAPVRANTTVTSVRPTERGYVVQTDQDTLARPVGGARLGRHRRAKVPALQAGVPAGITTLTPADYRNPSELPDGGVLVVGASASGIQIAEELHRSGRHGHARRRGARPDAAHLSRQGHPVVDGRVGAARRALRRDPRPRPGSQPAVDAVGRLTGSENRRPQRAAAGSGCDWSAGWPASGTGSRNSPARWPTRSRWPT